MILGKVAGEIVSTINHGFYDAHKLLIVDRITPEGDPTGGYLVATDVANAGVGDTVLIIDEGNSARQIFDAPNAPVRSVIVGVIDEIEVTTEKRGP